MRIAIDIDSTLHHYWDTLSAIALRRFGIELPYEEQFTWGITRLRPEQLEICIADSHADEHILAGVPYPDAVSTINAWRAGGHYIHVTSHRPADRAAATARWLAAIGLSYDDLCCSWDKVSRCVELDIDVLIDDSPHNLTAALERGIAVATIAHPWNRDICEEEGIPTAADWGELAVVLEGMLGGAGRDAGASVGESAAWGEQGARVVAAK